MEYHNLVIHRKRLSTTSVRQHLGWTDYAQGLRNRVRVYMTYFFNINFVARKFNYFSFVCEVYKKSSHSYSGTLIYVLKV